MIYWICTVNWLLKKIFFSPDHQLIRKAICNQNRYQKSLQFFKIAIKACKRLIGNKTTFTKLPQNRYMGFPIRHKGFHIFVSLIFLIFFIFFFLFFIFLIYFLWYFCFSDIWFLWLFLFLWFSFTFIDIHWIERERKDSYYFLTFLPAQYCYNN